MTNKNKQKGNSFERKIVKECEKLGLSAKRSWGSDGRSFGEDKEVDLLVEGYKIQCKKGYNQPSTKLKEFLTNVDFCVWSPSDGRKDSNSDYVFMNLETFLTMLLKATSKR